MIPKRNSRASAFPRLPASSTNLRIGLFGGSFDPVHEGHIIVSQQAFSQLGLDQIWWLFSPQNPLKPNAPAPFDVRLAAARARVRHPAVKLSDIEAQLGTRFTIDTLRALRLRAAEARFVLLLGADSFAGLHRWKRWHEITRIVPIAVLDRPGWRLPAMASPAAHYLHRNRVSEGSARLLAGLQPPAWCYIGFPGSPASSTQIRRETMANEPQSSTIPA